jgi:hypothetical protein
MTKWHCERYEAGWLLIADVDGAAFAYHLKADEFKTAHEPAWYFWAAIRSLTRAVKNYGELK